MVEWCGSSKAILGEGPFLSLHPLSFQVSFHPALADVLNISVFDEEGTRFDVDVFVGLCVGV